ncbi:MAG: MFS transporter [Coriobacteriaceae bacterium]|nr:MFS transporter [Coriobacteriaceae bacterium]
MASLLLAVIYLTFISLGLPDSLLGTAWPVMHADLAAPIAAQSLISIIISCCTIASSLLTARLVHKLGTGKLTALSVALTAGAILGFSATNAFWQLCLIAIPYGLGAGAIDSALNNYVALNYGARHMSWLHCCWGIGASVGPLVMGWALAGPLSWHAGYLAVGAIQAVITVVLLLSLPLWKSAGAGAARQGEGGADGHPAESAAFDEEAERAENPGDREDTRLAVSPNGAERADGIDSRSTKRPDDPHDAGSPAPFLTNRELLALPGARAAIGSFGFYCAMEGSIGLWIASYLVMARGIDTATAASIVAQFYLGITAGRLISGFVAQWLTSENQIRIGQALIAIGLVGLFALNGSVAAGASILLMGLGCAPIYPSIVALTPKRFGERASQGLVSLQMACAYAGSMLVPPVFGLVAGAGGATLIPVMVAALLCANALLAERATRKTSGARRSES